MDRIEYVDGTPVDFAALKGKPTVVYFGADWCLPCIERGRPTVLRVLQKYAHRGLQVVFESMDDNRLRAAKQEEAAQTGMRIAMARQDLCPPGKCPDGLREVGAFGRVFVYPTAVVLDAQGIVRAKMDRGVGVAGGLESAVLSVLAP
jgi:thiol-disulfide isomerase/thioredoxin